MPSLPKQWQVTEDNSREYRLSRYKLISGNCLDVLSTLPSSSIDAIITDPPYPCVKRPYGTWTIPQWESLMHDSIKEFRRVLTPTGSAVIILQPNSEHLGTIRPWLWDFVSWCCREWNLIQDVYWWNPTTVPTVHTHRTVGLLRPSVKICVWLGSPKCYRNQDAVLWEPSDECKAQDRSDRALRHNPSGNTMRKGRAAAASDERGGTTPYNLLPIANSDSSVSSGANGHGAGTPLELCTWWVKYISPPEGTVLDPFCGAGTVGIAALNQGRKFVGIEVIPDYINISRRRLNESLGIFPPLIPLSTEAVSIGKKVSTNGKKQ